MEKLCLESGKMGFNERKRDHEARFGKKSGGKQRNLERERERTGKHNIRERGMERVTKKKKKK